MQLSINTSTVGKWRYYTPHLNVLKQKRKRREKKRKGERSMCLLEDGVQSALREWSWRAVGVCVWLFSPPFTLDRIHTSFLSSSPVTPHISHKKEKDISSLLTPQICPTFFPPQLESIFRRSADLVPRDVSLPVPEPRRPSSHICLSQTIAQAFYSVKY